MSYIIHGASGAQGAPLLLRLKQAGKSVTAAVHRADALVGVPIVMIDNGSVDSLAAAYRGTDGVFIHLPQTSEAQRIEYAHNIAQAVAMAQPKRVVISTSGVVVDEPGSPLQASPESAIAVLIEEVRKTGVSLAIVAPRLYLENLLLPPVYRMVLSDGILRYPLHQDMAVSWSSHLDVAEVCERLLADRSITGVVGIGHLPGLTGAELAAGFAQHLGVPVRFESLAPHDFRALIEPMFGEAAARNVVGFYQVLQDVPKNTIASPTCAQELLGLAPRTVAQWLAGVATSFASLQNTAN